MEKVEKDVDNYPLLSYIGYMKEKKITITSRNITPKQWAALILELNLIKQAWRPYARLELMAPNVKKIITQGKRRYDARD